MSEANLSLKVLTNKQKSKVLFAEANNHVVDVLLSFLTMPLGKIVRIFEKHYGSEAPVVGSLTTLYRGLVNLDIGYFSSKGAKGMLVNPKSSSEGECRRLVLDITDSHPHAYFVCENSKCDYASNAYISLFPDIWRCKCGEMMSTKLVVGERLGGERAGGVFTSNTSSFIISDDLRVVPNVTGFVETLNNLDITDTEGEVLKSFGLGIKNIMDLLKCALISTTPLTDLFINSGEICPFAAESEPEVMLEKETVSDDDFENIILKVSLQKSTGKFLFAQAKHDFIELLFSFLTISLGGVECILNGKTRLKNIDNLYKSVSDGIDHKYFMTADTRNGLINPKLAHGYANINKFTALIEESRRELYWYRESMKYPGVFSHQKNGHEVDYYTHAVYFLEDSNEYIVSDDLTVTPYSIEAIILILNSLGVSLSDVTEVQLAVGLNEALGILKASLTSTTALTEALIHPMLENLEKVFTEGIRHVMCLLDLK